jgi:predicted O-linked N-acetylglucosamine transferase (SPINDLY family)
LLVETIERHDRERFQTIAISYGPDTADKMRERIKGAFEMFVDVRDRNDGDTARLLRELEVDIAVDLTGFTQYGRFGILALRPAPLQVSHLGYLGTTSAECIDYIIADRYVIPDEHRACYTEKIATLPDTFQANPSKRTIGEHIPTRAEAGLPDKAFVFCSFNNNYKFTPPIFDVWMRLLREVDSSVLWLLANNPDVERNLRREAAVRGVPADRLIFAPRVSQPDYLARYALADLFLDTLPHNASTTASDALSAGTPIVTCSGQTFAARMAGSILNAAGLPEMVTSSLEDYERLALKLASDGRALADIRTKLAQNRKSCPLFDADRYRRNLEASFVTMWERQQRGEPPASFAVG